MPEILDVHDILALKMSHASTLIMNDRQKPQTFQNKLNTQQECVNFVNHLDRIRVLATLCPVKSKVDGELLAGMLVLSSRSPLLGSNPIVWLCDQEPAKSFQKGPPPEKAKLKRCWTYPSQFRLTVHHIPGIKNELSDYISRNNFDALIGESSEALAREAFQRMDVQLDLSMRTAGILEGWSLTDYQSEYEEILQTLSTGLEPRVIDGHQW